MTEKTPRIRLGSLWMRKMQNGGTFLSGSLGDANIQIFQNGYKTSDNHPDYVIYLAAKPPKQPQTQPVPTTLPEEDIPF